MTREISVNYAPLSNNGAGTITGHRMATIQPRGVPSESRATASGMSIPLDTLNLQGVQQQSTSIWPTPESVYLSHSSGQRISTDVVVADQLRRTHPNLSLSIIPAQSTDLLAYAGAGHAQAIPQTDPKSDLGKQHLWRSYIPPGRRIDNDPGSISQRLFFGQFIYRWTPAESSEEHEFILYVVEGRDSVSVQPVTMQYILSPPGQQSIVDLLVVTSGTWLQQLRGEIWVFDQGWWQKSAELWNSVKNASWSDVILDEEMKNGIRSDVEGFFDARDTYDKLKVPWKRGIIFYGPPGNGKTISIKAMMHTLYERKSDPIPTLYVRSLKSVYGGEYSIGEIFSRARQQAPCYLVFEDLDSLVTDQLRSYFLNEVDGLKSNDGILMLGSTNHLERLDPGISKRPSRFDRKYLFANPDERQREQYCAYWQGKLRDNKQVEFPDVLCGKIAGITQGFSFAYLQEAFVASLLSIARRRERQMAREKFTDDPLDKYVLWVEMKRQIKSLREGLEKDHSEETPKQATDGLHHHKCTM